MVYHSRSGFQNPYVSASGVSVRILILQFVPGTRERPVPRYEPKLAILLALLKQRGHELGLQGLARFDVAAVKSALARSLPKLIYADVSAVCVTTARRTFQYIQEHEFLPIIVGGEYATVDPPGALSLPGVEAAALGEPDATLITYFERMKDPAVRQVVQGIWLRDERGLARPELPSLIEDLDSLPFGERDLFGYTGFVRATVEAEIAIGRGCPQQCAYCLNRPVAEMYAGRGTWVRRRSPDHILGEIEALRARYADIRMIRFLDHSFALDTRWLKEFLGAYATRCGLPFRCHLRANQTADATIRELGNAGCALADVEVVSGSDFIRNEIFAMELDELQLRAAFDGLRATGIRTRAIVYLGAPYDSEASLEDTRALLRKLRPDFVSARSYYPWPGTAAAAICREHGWTHSRGEEQYHQDRCGTDLPACRPDLVTRCLKRIRRDFPLKLAEPWWRRWSSGPSKPFGSYFQRLK